MGSGLAQRRTSQAIINSYKKLKNENLKKLPGKKFDRSTFCKFYLKNKNPPAKAGGNCSVIRNFY